MHQYSGSLHVLQKLNTGLLWCWAYSLLYHNENHLLIVTGQLHQLKKFKTIDTYRQDTWGMVWLHVCGLSIHGADRKKQKGFSFYFGGDGGVGCEVFKFKKKKKLLQNLVWLGNTNYNDRKVNTTTKTQKNHDLQTLNLSPLPWQGEYFPGPPNFDNLIILTATSEMP